LVERVRTGIAELDKMLHGGFLERDAVIVAGFAGSGKTTLALQYLVNGATMYGENGIYVTFEQTPDQLYRDAETFGWNLRALEEQNKLRVVCTSPDLLMASEGGEHLLDSFLDEVHPRRIVIDSLSHMSLYVEEQNLRNETYRLIMYMRTKGLSSLMTAETQHFMGVDQTIAESSMAFLVDAIVLLRPVEIGSTLRRALAVIKMRGSAHDKDLREYEITSGGFTIGAPFSGYEGIMSGSARRAPKVEAAVDRFSAALGGTGKGKRP